MAGHSHTPDRTDIDRTQALLGERYELSWIIGRGGMSTVWLAWDKTTQRDVAIKILKPEYTDNDEFRARFRNEAEASQHLRSDNVVATYDYGEVHDHGAIFSYIVMEYVRGESLADVLSREKTLPESIVLDVLSQAARGLDTIHSAGMVHRDIKPGNLLITSDGVVKVTDFGIAKAAEAVPLTRTGMVVGTAQYVSPEQAQGLNVGAPSDVYSLGVVGYEMLAGRRPFVAESTVSVAIKHISEQHDSLPDTVSPHLSELIDICLRKRPEMRYHDGQELAAAAVLVAQGNYPPQPDHMPEDAQLDDLAQTHLADSDYPATDHTGATLGGLASGPGTRVPPRQGPGIPRKAKAVKAASSEGSVASAAPVASADLGRSGKGSASADQKSPAGSFMMAIGLLAVAALILAVYMVFTGSQESQPSQQPVLPATTTAPESSEEVIEDSAEPEDTSTQRHTTQSAPKSTTASSRSSHSRSSSAPRSSTSSEEEPTVWVTTTVEDAPVDTGDDLLAPTDSSGSAASTGQSHIPGSTVTTTTVERFDPSLDGYETSTITSIDGADPSPAGGTIEDFLGPGVPVEPVD